MQASIHKNEEYVWVSRLTKKRISRIQLQVKGIDLEGNITNLENDIKVKYLSTPDIFNDLYQNIVNQEKILIFKS